MPEANVRFWVHADNSYVKLTMKPGQILNYHVSKNTEEGWTYYDSQWEYDTRGIIFWKQYTDGSDCDGRLSRSMTQRCATGLLKVKVPYDDNLRAEGHLIPVWEEVEDSRRDYEAERAGY